MAFAKLIPVAASAPPLRSVSPELTRLAQRPLVLVLISALPLFLALGLGSFALEIAAQLTVARLFGVLPPLHVSTENVFLSGALPTKLFVLLGLPAWMVHARIAALLFCVHLVLSVILLKVPVLVLPARRTSKSVRTVTMFLVVPI